MDRLAIVALLAAATLAAACARTARVESGPSVGEQEVVGIVRQIGSTPFPRTVIEGEETVTVTGEYEAELTRLVGARVRAAGEFTTGPMPGRYLSVESYELLDVDGVEPEMGILRHDERGYRLERADGESLPLAAVSEGLAKAVGGKVWVVLGEGGVVERYGIIVDP
ncbi:MAG: hypothetical protein ACE5JR_11050 [Gemmatimonadota bacterium]